MYYTPIAFFVTIIIGVIVSGISGWKKPETLDPALISPLIRARIFRGEKARCQYFDKVIGY
jgi:hypothetical protein